MTRYLIRTGFIIASLFAVYWVWQVQHQTTHAHYSVYTQQLGKRLSQIAAGSLSPWLNQTLISSDEADFREHLESTLSTYLALGHFRGITVFNRYGVELGKVGEIDSIIDFVAQQKTEFSVFVAPITVANNTAGYIRFVVDDDIIAAQQQQLQKQQQGMFTVVLLLGIFIGGFWVRLYYRKARYAFAK
jgi:uncharacterized membrane protein affecting hemolysin expression